MSVLAHVVWVSGLRRSGALGSSVALARTARPIGDASSLSPEVVLSKIESAYIAGRKRCYRELLKKDARARGKVSLSLAVIETGRTREGAAHGSPPRSTGT